MTTKSLKQATRQYPTPALEKGLDILKLFASESGGLSKSDVARRLGRTVSEIFRNAFVSRRARLISQSRDGERYRGYEERASYEVDGVINIPVPVLDDRGRAIAALTVPFLQSIGDQTTPATVREVLQKASVLLSESITAEAAS